MSNQTAPQVRLPEPTIIELADGVSTAVVDSGPPANGSQNPPVVLLHGWCVNSYVNYGSAYEALAAKNRVIMFDVRGHGNGAPINGKIFTLETNADDVVRVLDELSIDRATIVGYSLGGAVAQLVAHRAPERVASLVLAATSELFCGHRGVRWEFKFLELSAEVVKRLPNALQTPIFHTIATISCLRYPSWVRPQVLQGDPVAILEAGADLGRFNSAEWIGELNIPVAMIVTAEDRIVPPDSQYRLADDAKAVATIQIKSDHDIPVRNDQRLTDALVEAVHAVQSTQIDQRR